MTDLLALMGDTARMPVEPKEEPVGVTEHREFELVLIFDNEVRGEILVSTNGDEASGFWLRKSQIQYVETGRRHAAMTASGKAIPDGLPILAVNLPEWLAKEKGLI